MSGNSNASFRENRFSADNGSRVNSSEIVQENLDYRNHENDQMQRNSTILDSQNEILPFKPDSNLTLPR